MATWRGVRLYCVTSCFVKLSFKVLLIDTDAERAQALDDKLLQSGFTEVWRASAGSGLAEAVQSNKPDLVIIDMALPGHDALEDIRAVSAHSIVRHYRQSIPDHRIPNRADTAPTALEPITPFIRTVGSLRWAILLTIEKVTVQRQCQ